MKYQIDEGHKFCNYVVSVSQSSQMLKLYSHHQTDLKYTKQVEKLPKN